MLLKRESSCLSTLSSLGGEKEQEVGKVEGKLEMVCSGAWRVF